MQSKYVQLLPRQDEPGVKAELELLQKSMNDTSGVLLKIGEANPEYFAGEWMQVEAALVDYNATRSAEDWQAKNSANIAKLPDTQLKALFEVLSGGDVDPSLQFELPGVGKITVENMRKLDPRVMNGLRSNVGRWISEREQAANQAAAEVVKAGKEQEKKDNLVRAGNMVALGVPPDKAQRDAVDSEFVVQMGALSEDGLTVMPAVLQQNMGTLEGQRKAISMFETYRHLPVPASTWLLHNLDNGNWKQAVQFMNNLREAQDPRSGARVGAEAFNSLPKQARNQFFAVTTMLNMAIPEEKIGVVVSKMRRGEHIPSNLAETRMKPLGLDFGKVAEEQLLEQFPGIDKNNLNKQLKTDYRDIANVMAMSDVPADQIARETAKHIKSGWGQDKKLVGGIGPKKFVDLGITDRELDRGLAMLRPPLKAQYSFAKGTLALEPVQRGDAREGFGLWNVRARDPRTGILGAARPIDLDRLVDRVRAQRAQLRDPQLLAARQAAARAEQQRIQSLSNSEADRRRQKAGIPR
jgi:hypothetical protein